jgi:hypothetical protein
MAADAGGAVAGKNIRQCQRVDTATVERAVFRQPLRRLASGHPGRADNEEVHSIDLSF